ncbi:Gfo/Idh/MocA family oxidoreductase [Candidatus Bathycorpusculum sp.]|uniref:Gfo/Idh/MocA family protein n=1 Tax=Candidatus Bathycorpusculum sp. TaxID=2994959 RepID=UPI00282D5DEA|nr:Gfo/Idh/MocA family oxidoreductase [Candidatus Termitimicrobium sp.]MCL2431299.1 Gfo/Idh/MocA family oxidoreductase [Candidatus Termitimicrobium sp.]
MENKQIQIGLIGAGGVGQMHLKHGLMLRDAKITAVADTAKPTLERAKALGIKNIYTDYTEMLKNPQINAVIIALPTHLHHSCALQAAESGKDIFLEKPITVDVQEAKEVISAAQRNSVKLMLGYPMRFNRRFLKLKADMAEGLIGDPENVHATYVCAGPFVHRADGHSPAPVPDWWFNTQFSGGGALADLGCHIINLLRMLFGEIVDIKGQFGYRYNMDFEDSAMCLARFTSGTLAAINVGWYAQEYLLRLDVLGSVRNVSVGHMPPKTMPAAYQMLTHGISEFNQPHFDELQYFVNCLHTDQEPTPTGLDGLRDLEAITKAYRNKITL